MFSFNAQHDCQTGLCAATGTRLERQEHETTTQTAPVIEHSNDTHFIINLHALHNAALLREALPRNLTAPTPLHPDSREFCDQTAVKLRILQTEKRKKSAAKAKATRLATQIKKKGVAALTSQDPNLTKNIDLFSDEPSATGSDIEHDLEECWD